MEREVEPELERDLEPKMESWPEHFRAQRGAPNGTQKAATIGDRLASHFGMQKPNPWGTLRFFTFQYKTSTTLMKCSGKNNGKGYRILITSGCHICGQLLVPMLHPTLVPIRVPLFVPHRVPLFGSSRVPFLVQGWVPLLVPHVAPQLNEGSSAARAVDTSTRISGVQKSVLFKKFTTLCIFAS